MAVLTAIIVKKTKVSVVTLKKVTAYLIVNVWRIIYEY